VTNHDVTGLLLQYANGDETALARVLPIVYDTLLDMARRTMKKHGPIATIDTSGLVHEAYLRLVDQSRLEWANGSHFLAVYSLAMRNVLVDLARRRSARKRGGDRRRVELEDSLIRIDEQADEILAIHEALERLAERSPRLSRTVECRFFAGLTEPETARALQVSERTVRRDWMKAKAFLYDLMNPEG
jgi:RNA polymerase sigma factor (TIGR02999 family)